MGLVVGWLGGVMGWGDSRTGCYIKAELVQGVAVGPKDLGPRAPRMGGYMNVELVLERASRPSFPLVVLLMSLLLLSFSFSLPSSS